MKFLTTTFTVSAIFASGAFAGDVDTKARVGAPNGLSFSGFGAIESYSDSYNSETYAYSQLTLKFKGGNADTNYGIAGMVDIWANEDDSDAEIYPRVWYKTGPLKVTLGHAQNALHSVDRRYVGYLGAWTKLKYVEPQLIRADYRQENFRVSLSIDEDDYAAAGFSYKLPNTKIFGGFEGHVDNFDDSFKLLGVRHKFSDKLLAGVRLETTSYYDYLEVGAEYQVTDKLRVATNIWSEDFSGTNYSGAELGASFEALDNLNFYGTYKQWCGGSSEEIFEVGLSYDILNTTL